MTLLDERGTPAQPAVTAAPAVRSATGGERSNTGGEPVPRTAPGRDRYIDTLRALALVRVVTYHLLGWAWLPLVFPSMGIMFAFAGGLVAASLDRRSHWTVLRSRLRRLLPSLWAMGLVLVPVMLWRGWTYDATMFAGQPLGLDLLFWLMPFGTPPSSEWGADFVLPLWYLRTYLWLLLLSPMLLWLFRRWPVHTLLAPLLVLAAFTSGLVVANGSRTDELTISLCTFAACWLLGFAHHDGLLRTSSLLRVLPIGAGLMAAGALWAWTHPRLDTGWNINEIPVANALYCLGAVLLLLRLQPSLAWLARARILGGLIAVFNARALTIYLWSNLCILVAIHVEQVALSGRWYDGGDAGWERAVQWALTWLCLAAAVLALGWVEDVAARRPVRLNPWPRTAATAGARGTGGLSHAAGPFTGTVIRRVHRQKGRKVIRLPDSSRQFSYLHRRA